MNALTPSRSSLQSEAPTVRAWLHYSHCPPDAVAGETALVFDILRASTTIVHALSPSAGAAADLAVFTSPQLALQECDRLTRAGSPRSALVLGGERAGVRIPTFDLGNSPAEYTRDSVADKSILFTTTNGTVAVDHVHAARHIFIASFANLSAVVDAAVRTTASVSTAAYAPFPSPTSSPARPADQVPARAVHLVCAGINAGPAYEDALCAGAVAHHLAARGFLLDDAAILLRQAWLALTPAEGESLSDALARELPRGVGGLNLLALHFHADIPLCARIDSHACAPRLDKSSMRFVI